jgi:hypothetical protein
VNTLLPNLGNFDQAKEMLKQQAKKKLKNELKKKLRDKVAATILTNPIFWIVIGILLGFILVFYLIAAAVSTSQGIANETQISEKIVPPQIYVTDLEDAITSDYGGRVHPVTGQLDSFHSGIDIGVPTGTPVSSSFDGVVSRVSFPTKTDPESTKNAGIYIVVQSNDPEVGMSSRYLHLSESFVTPGQSVKKGEVIGLSGNTGRSTGAHLHFEMIPDGEEAIDPKPYVLLMSKLTDTASREAFRALKKISWTNGAPNAAPSSKPYYESNKMLYISNVYMETAAPAFNERGTVYIRSLHNGGSSDISATSPDGGTPVTPDPEDTVSVPPDLGNLTHPFYIQYAAAAQSEERRSGVPASITLAQAALESGYGKRSICNNMFGIKANSGYKGASCTATTHEEVGGIKIEIQAKFRSYNNPAESFADHSDFLLHNSRYWTALTKKNPYEFANELQRAGYATDSQYANLLKSLIRSQNLASLDMNRGIDPVTGQPFNDVSFVGGGGGSSGSELVDSITVTFGIRQYFGHPASIMETCKDIFGKSYTCYNALKDQETGNPIINLVNYNRVVDLIYGPSTISAPDISMKDIPDAISVTVDSAGEDDLFVSRVEYIKGKY